MEKSDSAERWKSYYDVCLFVFFSSTLLPIKMQYWYMHIIFIISFSHLSLIFIWIDASFLFSFHFCYVLQNDLVVSSRCYVKNMLLIFDRAMRWRYF